MPANRVAIWLTLETTMRVENLAAEGRLTTSELIRLALERTESVSEAAKRAGIIGAVDGLPGDLSNHAKHFQGFGEA